MTDSPYDGMTAVLYARVSTDDKDQTTESQIREMKKWCEANGVRIDRIYEEEESAKDMDRHELDAALGRIGRGGINILLAWSESRLSRDMDDMSDLTNYVSRYGTVIRYVSSSSIVPEDQYGKLVNTIGTWQAEVERKKLSDNTKNGMRTRMERGIHCGRMLAFCFTHRVAENRAMVQTSEDAKRTTYIMSLNDAMDYARQGMTTHYVAKNIAHVAPTTFINALKAEGKLEEYRSLCENARRNLKQGVPPTRGVETPEIPPTRGEE